MNYSKLSIWGTIISSKPARLNVSPGSQGEKKKNHCILEIAMLSHAIEAPISFCFAHNPPLCLWEKVCVARGGGRCCSMRYESAQIFWSVRCYPRVSRRWISRSCLLVFLLLKMNAEVLYSRVSSSSLWAGSQLPLARASSPLINVSVQGFCFFSAFLLTTLKRLATDEHRQLNIISHVCNPYDPL